MQYPAIDPIALSIGAISIHWYGLMYLIGISLAYFFSRSYFEKELLLTKDQTLNCFSIVILSLFLGGRLGYILFYNLSFYIANPMKVLAVWQGGMSYHGGAIGCVIGMAICAKYYKLNLLKLLDILGISSTFGIALGRIGNFINGELIGKPSTLPWAMVFPHVDHLPRHPSQLYESFFEGVLLFIILFSVWKRFKPKPGLLFSLYLIGYAFFRFILEYTREPDAHLGAILFTLSMGQVLSLVMGSLGIALISYLTIGKKE